ncbi:MAG: hypothetical protein DRN55_03270 [Thermoplasmata archaeon]|nr:MAG: hypothetical protein DRN55_03270 [Thermoplasmata archaeon]
MWRRYHSLKPSTGNLYWKSLSFIIIYLFRKVYNKKTKKCFFHWKRKGKEKPSSKQLKKEKKRHKDKKRKHS